MSDTPRTNAESFNIDGRGVWVYLPNGDYTKASFSRQLERDLTTLRSLASDMAAEMEQHGGEMAFDSLARYRAALEKEAKP